MLDRKKLFREIGKAGAREPEAYIDDIEELGHHVDAADATRARIRTRLQEDDVTATAEIERAMGTPAPKGVQGMTRAIWSGILDGGS